MDDQALNRLYAHTSFNDVAALYDAGCTEEEIIVLVRRALAHLKAYYAEEGITIVAPAAPEA